MVTPVKMRETTRRGRIRTSRASINNPNFLETITRIDGKDVLGLQKSGDIILVNPDTGVKERFVPPSGKTIEILNNQEQVVPRRANNGRTIVINRQLESIPYIDDVVCAAYNEAPTADLFDRNVIYVVEKDVFVELLTSCALAGQPLPATFAVPEDKVCDPTGHTIGYAKLVLYQPGSTVRTVESCGHDQALFEL